MSTGTTGPEAATAQSRPAGERRDSDAAGGRRYDVDLVRIVACISVIILHTSGLLLREDIKDPDGGAVHWVGLAGDTFGRFAVPAFLAVAGWAVLVGSPPRSSAVLMRRVVRVVIPLGVWTAAYLLGNTLFRGVDPAETGRLAAQAVFGSIRPAFHLWYLYSYIPLLVLLGCVRLLIAGVPLRAAGTVLLVLALLPTVAAPVAVLSGFDLPKTQWQPAFYQIVFAFGGAALLNRAHRPGPRVLVPCTLLAFLTVLWWQHTVQFPSPYGTPAVAAYAAFMVLLITTVRIPERARLLVRTLGDASFGVYLVHLLLLQALLTWVVSASLQGVSAAVALVGVSVMVVIASFLLSLLWGKLGWRRLLG